MILSQTDLKAWNNYLNALSIAGIKIPESDDFTKKTQKIFYLSPFVANFAQKYPEDFYTMTTEDLQNQSLDYHLTYAPKLKIKLKNKSSETDFLQTIRVFRKQECCRIVWQHIFNPSFFAITSINLSTLANTLIQFVHDFYLKKMSQEQNLIESTSPLLILGMGKLGGGELNFSSDVDLIFLYQEDGYIKATEPNYQSIKKIPMSNFYTKLGQKIINAIHKMTADGFVYRVDMRLRPFGASGALAISINAFENYCLKHGRDWERYAYIKANIITGHKQAKKALAKIIYGFVYRPYIDYKMPSAIREMKHKIMKEMSNKNLDQNLKLGRGGIREVEFIAQCFQLIYGGQNRHLTQASLKKTLNSLAKADVITPEVTNKLYLNYVFLRDIENSLQMINDQQTHTLPKNHATEERVTNILGFRNWNALLTDINATRDFIQDAFDSLTHFEQISNTIGNPPSSNEKSQKSNIDGKTNITSHSKTNKITYLEILTGPIDQYVSKIKQSKLSCESSDLIVKLLTPLRSHPLATEILNQSTLESFLRIITTIKRRPTYLYLLTDRQNDLENIFKILIKGSWFANILIKHPFLLEAALTPILQHDEIYLTENKLKLMLQQSISNIYSDDNGILIEAICRFKLEQTFTIAIAESYENLTIMETSDVLSALAKVIIQTILEYAWSDIFDKYPSLNINQKKCLKSSLAIISYGKLGGLEIGFDSDLDLIFLYQSQTDIENSNYIYTKVIQKFVSYMHTQTNSGKLYEIDLRLRPEGSSGLLISSIESYEAYQQKSAWTWEHQALVRARWICGCQLVLEKFTNIRMNILQKKRSTQKLKKDILKMRAKMRDSLMQKRINFFDLKQGLGGLVDIEFLAQFFALEYTRQHFEISTFTDNIRIFQSLESAQLLIQEEADGLIQAYCFFRDKGYQCLFNQKAPLLSLEETAKHRDNVTTSWNKWLIL